MWLERDILPGVARVVGGLSLAACLLGCNVVLGVGAVAVLGGVGYVAGQCYDQVSVRVHDEAGQPLCDARVSVERDGSVHRLRPCYHASLTSGAWHFRAEQTGYEPAAAELSVPERNGPCPHYTHSLELTLRRIGAPREAPFAPLKAAPNAAPLAPKARVRPALPLGPAFPPASGGAAPAPSPAPSDAHPAPVPEPVPAPAPMPEAAPGGVPAPGSDAAP